MSTHVCAWLLILGLVSVSALPRELFQDNDAEDEDIIPGLNCPDGDASKSCCATDCTQALDLGLLASEFCCSSDINVEVCCPDPRAQFGLCVPAQERALDPPDPNDLSVGRFEVCSWTCCANTTVANGCPQNPLFAPAFVCGTLFDGTTQAPTTGAPTSPTTMSPTTVAPTSAPTTAAPTTAQPTSAPTATMAPTSAPTSAPTDQPTTSAPTVAPTSAPTVAPTTGAPTDVSSKVSGICDRRCSSIGWERNRNRYRSMTKDLAGQSDEAASVGITQKQMYGGPGPYGHGGGMPFAYNPYVPGYHPMMNPYYGRPQCDPYNWNSNWWWCQHPPPPPPVYGGGGPNTIPTDNGPREAPPDVADCYRRGGHDCACSCDRDCTKENDCCSNYNAQCVF